MDYQLDLRVELITDSEYKNLYKWSLQEFDESGKQVGRAQIPWKWTLYFRASEMSHHFNLSIKNNNRRKGNDNSKEVADPVIESESICGILRPISLPREAGVYSMLGTRRTIDTFNLRIHKLKDGTKEYCSLWGTVSYGHEGDFEYDIQEDVVEITFFLAADRFEKIVKLIQHKSLYEVSVLLGEVNGFYSDWSPSIRTDRIKILANKRDQKLLIPQDCEIDPPTLGDVGAFEIRFVERHQFKVYASANEDAVED